MPLKVQILNPPAGWTPWNSPSVSSPVTVNPNPGLLGYFSCDNLTNNPIWLQFFNLFQDGVELGQTIPVLEYRIRPLGSRGEKFPDGMAFTNALTLALTTASRGSTPAAGQEVNIGYR